MKSVSHDRTFHVKIGGISGTGVPATHEYSVTLINPGRLTSNQQIAGPSSIPVGTAGNFTFTPPNRAEDVRVVVARVNSTAWKEDAEIEAKSSLLDGTARNYSLVVNPANFYGFGPVSGNKSFHLTFPASYDLLTRQVPQQWFEVDRDILPQANALIEFKYRRGFMTTTSSMVVEASTDGGSSWKRLGAPITGESDSMMDSSTSTATRKLPESREPVRVRFRYFNEGGAIYTHEATPDYPTGIFIDDIKTRNCHWLEEVKVNNLTAKATKFVFNATSAGEKPAKDQKWRLRLRTKLGGKWFAPGPSKIVTITG